MKQNGLISIAVIVAVVIGFWLVGSPQQERLRRFDERRVQDLQILQSEIINYWMNKNFLPNNLSALKDDIRGFIPPKDPQTRKDYDYNVGNSQNLIFELCAHFTLSNMNGTSEISAPKPFYSSDYYADQQNWRHDSGLVCFERKIDPDFYRPKQKF